MAAGHVRVDHDLQPAFEANVDTLTVVLRDLLTEGHVVEVPRGAAVAAADDVQVVRRTVRLGVRVLRRTDVDVHTVGATVRCLIAIRPPCGVRRRGGLPHVLRMRLRRERRQQDQGKKEHAHDFALQRRWKLLELK